MSKLPLLGLSALLLGALPACTITINGSGSEGNSSNQNSTDPGGDTSEPPVTSTDAPTGEPPTGATEQTGEPESSTTLDVPTTTADSTGEPVDTGSTGDTGDTGSTGTASETGSDATGSSSGDDGSSTGESTGGGYGMCGWNATQNYYACPNDNGVPGLADPKNNYAIDCPAQELGANLPCGDIGPAGCCTPEGTLYYCGENVLVEQQCGA